MITKFKEKFNKSTRVLCLVTAACLLLSGTMAYFTDKATVQTSGTIGTVKLSLDDNINLLNEDGQDILNPGDMRYVNFTVNNVGNKSIDTEVFITLTSTEVMSDNYYGDRVTNPDKDVYAKKVYSSEYELYWADDVEYIEGVGHYPKAGAKPVEYRRISLEESQIKYAIDCDVLSGDDVFEEREVEYKLRSDVSADPSLYVIERYNDYEIYGQDLSSVIDGATDVRWIETWFYDYNFTHSKVVIPNFGPVSTYEDNFNRTNTPYEQRVDYVFFYYSEEDHCVIPDSITDFYVGSNTKAFIVYEYKEDGDPVVYTKEEFENLFGVTVHYYDNMDDLVYGRPTTISEFEYNNLPDSEKSFYVKADDNQTFNMVLLFDPHSSNKFQHSSVSVNVEVRAKQHRNTEAGWELVTEVLASSIDQSTFIVKNDVFGKVTLMGVQPGVNLDNVKAVEIPEGVEVISDCFFYHMDELESVKLPSTIKELGDRALSDCISLKSINLPEGLESIGAYAFWDCGLEELVIPNSVTYIGPNAFEYVRATIYTDNALAINYFKGNDKITVKPLAEYPQ